MIEPGLGRAEIVGRPTSRIVVRGRSWWRIFFGFEATPNHGTRLPSARSLSLSLKSLFPSLETSLPFSVVPSSKVLLHKVLLPSTMSSSCPSRLCS